MMPFLTILYLYQEVGILGETQTHIRHFRKVLPILWTTRTCNNV
jgi:hypothetical protein